MTIWCQESNQIKFMADMDRFQRVYLHGNLPQDLNDQMEWDLHREVLRKVDSEPVLRYTKRDTQAGMRRGGPAALNRSVVEGSLEIRDHTGI